MKPQVKNGGGRLHTGLGEEMITVSDVVDNLALKVEAAGSYLQTEISGGYVGDLLSCVMGRATKGSIWVTVQAHPNVMAVATLVGLSAVIVAEGSRIDPALRDRAEQESIPLLSTQKASFQVVSELSALGVSGALNGETVSR